MDATDLCFAGAAEQARLVASGEVSARELVEAITGELPLLMTDFGIKPPSFMFGALKVGNEVKVKFTLKAGPELLAQLDAINRNGQ